MLACDNGTCKCYPRCDCRATCTCNRNLGFEQGTSDMSCFKAMAGLAFVFLFFFSSCFKAMAGLAFVFLFFFSSCFKAMAGLAFVFLFFFSSCFKAMTGLETTGNDAGHNDSSSCATKVDGNNNEAFFFATGVAGETGKTCARDAPYKDIGNGNGFFSNEA